MRIVSLTLRQANNLVASWHRHHKPVTGQRFSLGLKTEEGTLVGAVIVGRPVAPELSPWEVAEVTRLVTDGTKNACSMLYGAAARVCKEMGFVYIQTYILAEEPGISLRAAGWTKSHNTKRGDWNNTSNERRRGRTVMQPQGPKQCWKRMLNDPRHH